MLSQVKPKIAHLILAAGSSSRMGHPKQLLPWGNNTTLIRHAIQQALSVKGEVRIYVVLGAYYDIIYEEINMLPVTVLKHLDWEKGMGSSISYGITAIQKENVSFDGILISLIDQPLLDVTHFNTLITEFVKTSKHIIATQLESRIGVPAIFPTSVFSALMQLEEDFGARYIIKNYSDDVKTISASNTGIDIDTMKQYAKLLKRNFPT